MARNKIPYNPNISVATTPTPSLADALEQAKALILAAVRTSSSQLDALSLDPAHQNPSVRMLSTAPRAFVAHKSGLCPESWSPFAQDWGVQFDMLARLVRGQHMTKVRTLLEGGVIDDSEHGRVRLAPQVAQACHPIIGELSPC